VAALTARCAGEEPAKPVVGLGVRFWRVRDDG
jgi:hypothetical protein